MRIDSISVRNYRRLKDVKIDISRDTTLLVGPNNSGKSSAILAIDAFFNYTTRFKITDVSLSNLKPISEIGERWIEHHEADAPQEPNEILNEFRALLPSIDIWITAGKDELARFPLATSRLTDYPGYFGVRLALEPRDSERLRDNFLKNFLKSRAALKGWTEQLPGVSLRPTNLVQYLEDSMGSESKIVGYVLPYRNAPEPLTADATELSTDEMPQHDDLQEVDPTLIRRLVRVDVITATRNMSEADAKGSSDRISSLVGAYYANHLRDAEELSEFDIRAIHAEQLAIVASNERASSLLGGSLGEIEELGYPGGGNPNPVFESNKIFEVPSRRMYLRHKIEQEIEGLRNLDESMNGLGYQSLIYMIFCLMEFRRSWLDPEDHRSANPAAVNANSDSTIEPLGVEPIHLVLIEEPEAFLHAQVQQVFIRRALKVLRKENHSPGHRSLHSHLLVSTHSSHIAQELTFDSVRYIKRETATKHRPYPESSIQNLRNLFGTDDDTARFVKKVIRIHHCNMLFADALILIEGAAERILLPRFIEQHEFLKAAYVEVMEVGGAHAHKLRNLVDALGIPTLIITDIDSSEAKPSIRIKKDGTPYADEMVKVRPEVGKGHETSNPTIKDWLNRSSKLDDLLSLAIDERTPASAPSELVRFAYQMPLVSDPSVIPSTFEDALAFANLETIAGVAGVGLLGKFATTAADIDGPAEIAEQFYKDLENNQKTGFALDLIYSLPEGVVLAAPQYIAEGLKWLDSKISERGLLALPTERLSEERMIPNAIS